MRNTEQQQRVQRRNVAIYTQFRVGVRKHLRADYLITQLALQYFMSERGIRRVIREQSIRAEAQTTSSTSSTSPSV